MMSLGRRFLMKIILMAASAAIILSVYTVYSPGFMPPLTKPEQNKAAYAYYLIIDEATGKHLMYVPVLVHIDDEVLTEDNRIFKIVKIEENRAYARFVKNINLEKYK
jgi:hypothetical protein